jgi:hypothetical protein
MVFFPAKKSKWCFYEVGETNADPLLQGIFE